MTDAFHQQRQETVASAADFFTYDISDDALEAAAGNVGGLMCSCTPCTSQCRGGTRGSQQ